LCANTTDDITGGEDDDDDNGLMVYQLNYVYVVCVCGRAHIHVSTAPVILRLVSYNILAQVFPHLASSASMFYIIHLPAAIWNQ
jgi:hypothetical protein